MKSPINPLVFAIFASAAVSRQAQQVPDLEGGWTRLDLSGGGSYTGIDEMFPQALLTASALAQIPSPPSPQFSFAENGRPHAVGEAYVVTTGRCRGGDFGG